MDKKRIEAKHPAKAALDSWILLRHCSTTLTKRALALPGAADPFHQVEPAIVAVH